MLTTDPQGVITAWSAGAERIFGWTAQQMCGKAFDRLFSSEEHSAELLREHMRHALAEGKTSHERWYIRADGSRLRGAGTLTPLFCDGRHLGFLKILRDCTTEDAVAQRLADSDQRYRTLFDAIDAGFCVIEMKFDAEGRPIDYRFLETNPAFERQTGLADAVGKWMTDLAPAHEQHWFDIYGEVALSRRPVRFENNADALQRWYEVQAMPVGEPSEYRVAVLFNDVSARRSAELALQALTESLREEVATRTKDRNQLWELSSDVMIRCRFDGVIIAVNPAWQQLLGWSEAQLLGASTLDFLHPDDVPSTLETMRRSSQGESFVHFENRYRRNDGSYRWISWSSRPADAVINAVGRDITALKEQAQALELAEAQLRQSQKMEAVGQLTGGLAHDFNNLLTGIGGSLELLEKRIEQRRFDSLAHYVAVAQTATRRAAALTHRLLAFSRRQTLDPMATDVGELVRDLRELLSRTVGPSIKLETQMASGLWTTLVDRNQLENALLNLGINARDAMPDGGTLSIETCNELLDDRSALELDVPGGQYVRVCVTDTGVGMTEEVVSQAFDPFYTTKPLGMGTGLGLSMVYGFTRQSGGQVKIHSEPDRGTRICLFLPHVALSSVAADGGVELEAPRQASAGTGEIVLVVDDEPAVRMLVVEILQELGYRVLQAADGKEGLRILQSGAPIALLVTDVGLPGGMNGRQLADAARQRDPLLDVLFITGYAESVVMSNGLLEPGMRIVTKPFSIDALAARIAELRGDR
ncbi:histidine kinase [Stutzerimonas stutzeri]|uniref:histidine kinase n=2 Tax=Stutzerimonas stutzeri TaxID=316 RepID=W8QVN5_STUST|nr:PAS domain S-box protein [Stutzerimonas stutzeri]AHL74660.1 histidine kinase [Stutzerimonas stutzeri]MCQ4329190.1 PAS domain S-box protein [Stutzerimonas stutzeri]